MADLDRSVIYTFRMQNNVSPALREISSDTSEVKTKTDEATTSQQSLGVAIQQNEQLFSKQEATLLKDLALITAAKSATVSLTNSMIGLGIVTGDAAEHLQKINYLMQMFVGFGQGIKVINLLMERQAATQMKTAVLTTYNQVLSKPWMVAAVGAALGAAGGIIGMTMLNNNTTNNETQIVIENTSGSVETANQLNAHFSGGMMY